MVASPQNHPEFVPAGPASLHSKTATNTPRRDGDTAAPARPRRLLQLIETGGPGGAENVLRNLSRCARAHDIPVEVGLLREGWLADALREEGIEPWILPEPGRLDVGWAWRTAREVRRRGIDVIHAHEFAMNCAGSLVARLVDGGVELKCRRCKRTLVVPLTHAVAPSSAAGSGAGAREAG